MTRTIELTYSRPHGLTHGHWAMRVGDRQFRDSPLRERQSITTAAADFGESPSGLNIWRVRGVYQCATANYRRERRCETTPDLYVRRMVTNEYLSWRRRGAARDIASEHSTLDAIATPTSDPAIRYAERDAMRSRIAVLPRKQRAAILLRYYEDRTDAEIAEVLGCTAGTVRSHISRALDTLRAAGTAAGTRQPGSPVKEALS